VLDPMDFDKLKTLTDGDLEIRAAELLRDLYELRIKRATKELTKPHLVSLKRREYARILTILRQRRAAAKA
jgi:ribosomal protein L29